LAKFSSTQNPEPVSKWGSVMDFLYPAQSKEHNDVATKVQTDLSDNPVRTKIREVIK
jgi:hypothetical protein